MASGFVVRQLVHLVGTLVFANERDGVVLRPSWDHLLDDMFPIPFVRVLHRVASIMRCNQSDCRVQGLTWWNSLIPMIQMIQTGPSTSCTLPQLSGFGFQHVPVRLVNEKLSQKWCCWFCEVCCYGNGPFSLSSGSLGSVGGIPEVCAELARCNKSPGCSLWKMLLYETRA